MSGISLQEYCRGTRPQLPTGHHERNMVGPPKEAGMQWLTMCSRNEVKENQKIVWKKHHYAKSDELTVFYTRLCNIHIWLVN